MNKLASIALLCAASMICAATADAQNRTTYRDSKGRTVGSATTSGNKTTYRDAKGRTTGTATRSASGTTTYRNSQGRTVGSARRR